MTTPEHATPKQTASPDDVRMKRAFLAEMRHELRTPINGIIGYSELLMEDAEEAGCDEFLRTMQEVRLTGDKIAECVNDLLNAAAIEADGTVDLDSYGHRVRAALETPVQRVLHCCEEARDEASIACDAGILADLERIEGAVRKLPELADDIAAFSIEKVSSLQDTAIMEALRLPAQVLEEDHGRHEDAGNEMSGSVLVVEDNEINRDLLSRQLRRCGLRVTLAENGNQALKVIAAEKFDLILLDIVMPELGGYETIRRLKEDPETRDIPVIFLTGKSTVKGETKGFKLGASDYISKPFEPLVVKARVQTQLELVRQRRRIEELLENILPRKVIEDLKETGTSRPDSFENVTVMFSDFVDFTEMSARMSPETVIRELSELFTVFDEIVERNHCERIKTIGDAYLAVCGMPEEDPNHARNIVSCAMEIVAFLRARNARSTFQWKNRIGVHSGAVVGGIVGTKKYLYDIFGDAVNMAARVESSSEPLRISVSAATRDLLKGVFRFQDRGRITLKGKGEIKLFFVEE